MSKVISIKFPIEIKKSKIHHFNLNIEDDYIDGEDVEQQYPFTGDINRIALIKPEGYESVLIVTSVFNIRYTNWSTITEAKRELQYDDVVANCVTINGKKEYIIAREDDDIDSVYLPLVSLTHIDGEINNNIITATFKEEVKGAKKHSFNFELTDMYFDADEIDSEYEFSKDFDKIAIVKTPLYPKVILITQTLKLILTNWDSIAEANKWIGYDDLKAYYVHVDDKPICLVEDADNDIDGIYLRVPAIEETSNSGNSNVATYKYHQPKYYEANTPYERSLKKIDYPSFSDIRELSVSFVNSHRGKLDDLFEKMNHGVNILKTQEELYAYMYCFGKMHEAKLMRAFSEIPKSFFRANKEIEVIDYACGQGLATLCLNDYIEEQGYNTEVRRITLIEPSVKALSRAALHCHTVLPKASIKTLLTEFDDMEYGEIPTTKLKRIHLLSNILDMDCYNLTDLANIIDEIVNKGDIFICVDPWYHDQSLDGRQQRLIRKLKGSKIYHEAFNSKQLVTNKTWTAYITVFKI